MVNFAVVPLIPQFPALLSVSSSSATWLLTAMLVAGAVSAPVLGRLGDMYGKRRMLLLALGIILVSVVLVAVAPNFAVLLVAPAMQGVGFGVIAGWTSRRCRWPESPFIVLSSNAEDGVGGARQP